ncbi:hypothetical protein NQ314_005701 [Rhamnusium bicolor]|uniref:Double jelly roll-like domain-containing protein n=1 Tax=Rhamnusium bicolor TaxID=1586634 RepID=A0AAV8ZEV1_9CUCU|nr:hypothetical protein NQ314_005701 [Rhamnusium bicolor]
MKQQLDILSLLKLQIKLRRPDMLSLRSIKLERKKSLQICPNYNCSLKNIRIFLNLERYPYNDLYLDYDNNKFATLYEMFTRSHTICIKQINQFLTS